jgi:catechol 2,3-dioxygenase-like lactoylglutathione lyase family enzyme
VYPRSRPCRCSERNHAGIVVDDLAAATAFFVELGLRLQGEGSAHFERRRLVWV